MSSPLRWPVALAAAGLAWPCPVGHAQVAFYPRSPGAKGRPAPPPPESTRRRAAATSAQMHDAGRAAELGLARRGAPGGEVSSGRALNALLQAIQKQGRLNQAASPELRAETLRHVNVTAGTSAGSVGLVKDPSKLDWPDALLEPAYEGARKGLTSGLRKAVDAAKGRERPTAALRKDIDAHYKQISDRLNESAGEVPAQRYAEARRFLSQLSSGIKALKDPKVDNYFNNTWAARGKNVAELVENMTRGGLTFAPAAPGDEPHYEALYLALRDFDAGLLRGRE